jgi:hypothetical protein
VPIYFVGTKATSVTLSSSSTKNIGDITLGQPLAFCSIRCSLEGHSPSGSSRIAGDTD